jgi:AcrR family transcriptional regulator
VSPPRPPASPPPAARERLVDAALSVLSEQGLGRTSMRQVAKRARLSLGLAHYHFGTKEELLAATITASRARFLSRLEQTAPPPEASGAEVLRTLLELARALVDFMPEWYRLCTDVDALGVRSCALARVAAANKAQGALDVLQYLQLIVARLAPDAEPPALAGEASALVASFEGLAVRKLLDPSFEIDEAYLALERMMLARWAPGIEPVTRPWNDDPLGLRRLRKAKPGRKTRRRSR